MVKKVRKVFRKGTSKEISERNAKMFKSFQKLISTGKYGRMQVYEMLAAQFEIMERNSVGSIIRQMENNKEITK